MTPPVLHLGLAFLATLSFLLVRTIAFTALATHLSQLTVAKVRRVYRRCATPNRDHIALAAKVLLLDAIIGSVANALHVIRIAPSSTAANVSTFFAMFVTFEVWFYTIHRLMHTRALYRFHADHHTARVTLPITSLCFSMLERLVLVGGALAFAAAMSHVMPVSRAGLAVYFFSNYILNVIGHSNVEIFPAGFARSLLGRVFISVTFHAMHHARHRGHYGLFTRIADCFFSTEFSDYEAAQDSAASGNGFCRMDERRIINTQHATITHKPESL
jgi:Delta7-sterol 5-desaturase